VRLERDNRPYSLGSRERVRKSNKILSRLDLRSDFMRGFLWAALPSLVFWGLALVLILTLPW
jgi:hypothetical protein